jgi:CBS domain-containing protein
MTRVAELMSSPVVSCPSRATLGEVAALLVERRVHGVVVLDESGQAAGVVADNDLLAGEWVADDPESLETMRTMTAGELMSAPVVAIDVDADVAEASARIRDEQLAHLVVTRDGLPVGVLATSDLVRRLSHEPLDRATVADVMSYGVVACREDTTVAQAARAMTQRRARSLVVIGQDGHPLGIVTGADLIALADGSAAERPVAELMHAPLTIEPGATLREAADRMIQQEVHKLLVVDPAAPEAMPLGTISTADIVDEMAHPGSAWR